jgi:hypothetical protein
MKLTDLVEMAALSRHDMGFGLSQLENDTFVLVGGYRSGNSSAGQTRLRYDVYDVKLATNSANVNDAKIGLVDLMVNDAGDVVGLVNIVIHPKFRKAGYGSELVRDITDTTTSGLTIHDIQTKARKFWDKTGISYSNRNKSDGIINKTS